jgi:hypothetical protein
MARQAKTTNELLSEAAEIAKGIKKGKFRGKNLDKMRWKVSNLKWRAKKAVQKIAQSTPKPKPVPAAAEVQRATNAAERTMAKRRNARAPKQSKEISSATPYLNGFLEQMPNPSMNELVAQKVAEALQAGIQKRVDSFLDNVFPLKKAQ